MAEEVAGKAKKAGSEPGAPFSPGRGVIYPRHVFSGS